VTIDMTILRLRFARDTALEAAHGAGGVASDCGAQPCGVENPQAAETYDLTVRQKLGDAFGDGYIVNLGGIVRLGRDTFLGVAYHTPPGGATSVQNQLDGTVAVIEPKRDGGATLHGAATVYISQPASVDAELRTRVREDLELHVGGRWLNLSREAGWDVRMYGDLLSKAGVPEWTERPRGFHDTFALWGGVEQVYEGERLRLGARVGFETSAIDDIQTTAVTIAPASATLDVGGQLQISPQLVLQLSYGLQLFPGVDVTHSQFDPRDRIACVDGGYDYSTTACANTRAGYATPTGDGDYSRVEHAIRLGLRYDLP
jgi:long-subunit fatty acid transport protein